MSTAAALAAVEAQRQREEEEEMTPYSPNELAEGWEFKIVRSPYSSFRKPEKLRAVLEEESRGGWVLVEKFDNTRIRLKRPAKAKAIQGDFVDGYDPYRTSVGLSQSMVAMILVSIAALVAVSIVGIAFLRH